MGTETVVIGFGRSCVLPCTGGKDSDGAGSREEYATPLLSSRHLFLQVPRLLHPACDLSLRKLKRRVDTGLARHRGGEVLRHECSDVLKLGDADELHADVRHLLQRLLRG